MKETFFIQQNKEKWEEFEQEFSNENRDPEKLSNLFMQITDDLSYSRTYYPNRSVKIYLNNQAQKVFASIYRNRVRRRRKFIHYWKEDLPKLLFESRRQLLFAFLLFVVSMGVGILSSMHDPDFPRQILGDSYVNMTQENIDSGDPMAVYKQMNGRDMFFYITYNNLRVSFFCFILGIFFGAGTGVYILYNGIMLGAFQYFFIERDLFRESFLTIWVHGALEICAIIIAGAAGFELGKGLLFPGTYSRLQSFRKSAMRGLQVLLGIAPVIVIAGFNESYLTRHTEVPDIVRALLIILEFSFMLFYYVYYPYKKSRTGFAARERAEELPPENKTEPVFNTIKSDGDIFADAFILFGRKFKYIARISAFIAVSYCLLYVFAVAGFGSLRTDRSMKELAALLNSSGDAPLFLLNAVSFTVLFSLVFYLMYNVTGKEIVTLKRYFVFLWKNSLIFFVAAALLCSVFLMHSNIKYLLSLVLFPYICLFLCQFTTLRSSRREKLRGRFLRTGISNLIVLYPALLLLGFLFVFAVDWLFDTVGMSLLDIIKWNIPFSEHIYRMVTDLLLTFILLFDFFIVLGLICFNMCFLYYSHREAVTADELRARIAAFGRVTLNQGTG